MRQIKKITIAGAGRMGYLLAEIAAKHGFEVDLYNRGEKGLQRALRLIDLDLETAVEEGDLLKEEKDTIRHKINGTCEKDCFKNTDFVIESIIEDMTQKQKFLQEISQLVPDDTIITSNSSGLSITEMAFPVNRPERFCGMHWWNPPNIVPLVEITKGEKTSDETALITEDLCRKLGKVPVIVKKDVKGFIGNRLQYALLREALYLVKSGVATYEDIDIAVKNSIGMRYACIGPFETIDFNGVDIFNNVSKYMFGELDNTTEPPALFEEMIEKNQIGIRTGQGFYQYMDGEQAAVKRRDEAFKRVLLSREENKALHKGG